MHIGEIRANKKMNHDSEHKVLLEPHEPAPVVIHAGEDREWLIVCDHASNRVPKRLDTLGLSPKDLHSHIAYDIGAACVAARLSERLRAPLILSNYSRLVIDCNRYPNDPESVVKVSDHRTVQGNMVVTADEASQRRSSIFAPYHLAIDNALREAEGLGKVPAFISIHSCAPSLGGKDRPWQIGLAWSRDTRMSAPVLKNLAQNADLTVGDNRPYSLDLGSDFTTPEHAMTRGLAHLQIEFRQDLLDTPEAAASWADALFDAIRSVKSHDSWHCRKFYLVAPDKVFGIHPWM
jgi:predicted N-formylglutamate amidohydrolase